MKPTIGIITALSHEYLAVKVLLESQRPIYVPGDGAGRQYLYGEIPAANGVVHSIVLALLPDMGNNIASARTAILLQHFKSVHTVIMCGIAGGVPNPDKPSEHVRLGDIVTSNRQGVVQYDFVKEELEGGKPRIIYRHPPRPPSASLIETVRLLQAGEMEGLRPWQQLVQLALEKLSMNRPADDTDTLSSSTDPDIIIPHPADGRRVRGQPRVFSGPIASANKLLKNPIRRDQLRDEFGVKAVEMEGSGIADATWMAEVQYMVVRGVCDYCDKNKGDDWQEYAAVVAAAFTRTLLEATPAGNSHESNADRELPNEEMLPRHIPKGPPVGFVKRRDKEGRDIVDQLQKELAGDTNKIVALWGAGGVGKTAIAIEAAHKLGDTRRVIWISAERRADFDFSAFIEEIAIKLNQTELLKLEPEHKTAQVAAFLAKQPTLIVLDNFETIPVQDGTQCVEFLAQKFPYSALITTRQIIDRAHNVLVDAMQHQEAKEFLKLLINQSPEPALFADLDRERIIIAAGANPLVLQWSIAQLSLAQKPADVLEELATGEGDAAKRVFDRSFKLAQTGDDGRSALLSLSLFVPNASREAVGQVAGFANDKKRLNEALKRLASLRLIVTSNGGERVLIQGLTRELAKAKFLKHESATILRHRFVAYFCDFLSNHIQSSPEDLNLIEIEKNNALSALDLALSMQEFARALCIYRPLANFLDVRGYWDDIIQRGDRVVEAANNIGRQSEAAEFGIKVGLLLQYRGKYNEARSIYEKALSTSRQLADKANMALSLYQLGFMSYEQGNLIEADSLLHESLKLFRELGDEQGAASTLRVLGIVTEQKGRLDHARELYKESLRLQRQFADDRKVARILHDLALLAHREGRLTEARAFYGESLELLKRLQDPMGIAVALTQAGRLAEDEGDLPAARQSIAEALGIANELDYKPLLGILYYNLGVIEHFCGNWESAKELYNKSLEIRKSLNEQRGVARVLGALGSLAVEEGDLGNAQRYLGESLKIHESASNAEGIALVKNYLGLLSFKQKDLAKAANFFRDSMDAFRTHGRRTHLAECLKNYGELQTEQGDYSSARDSFDEALSIAQSIQAKHLIARVKFGQGLLEEKLQNSKLAYNLINDAATVLSALGFHDAKRARETLVMLHNKLVALDH
jgi:nucleoside phosphorylase/tetratricopeptide (TPR) repeat protein